MSMQPGPYEPLAVTLTERNRDFSRVEEMTGGVFRFLGFIEFEGIGELTVPVAFPVTFTEKPSFSFGGELYPGSPRQNGRLPTISGIVADWRVTTRKESANQRLYSAASFIIVVTGLKQQVTVFHFQLEGRGLQNPAGSLAPVGPAGVITGPNPPTGGGT